MAGPGRKVDLHVFRFKRFQRLQRKFKSLFIYIYTHISRGTGYYSHPGEGGYYSANPCMYLGKARMYP